MKGLLILPVIYLKQVFNFSDQLSFSNGNTHYFIVRFRINKIQIPYNFHQLTVINFRHQNSIKIFQNVSQLLIAP